MADAGWRHRQAVAWSAVGRKGSVFAWKTRKGAPRWGIDLRGCGADRLYSYLAPWGKEEPFVTEDQAQRSLERIRELMRDGMTARQASEQIRPSSGSLVLSRAAEYLTYQKDEVGQSAHDRLARDIRLHWQRWEGCNIAAVHTGAIDDWRRELSAHMAPGTVRLTLSGFHAFLTWLWRRQELAVVPPFPQVKVPQELRPLLTSEQQDAVLAAIPEDRRGIFLCLAELALRPGEARALLAADLGPEQVRIHRAVKGPYSSSPIGPTKTKVERSLPVSLCPRTVAWAAQNRPGARLMGELAFPSPSGGVWSQAGIYGAWEAACKAAGVPYVPLRDATRKSTATDWIKAGSGYEGVRAALGHTDQRTTEIYADPRQAPLSNLRRLTSAQRSTDATKTEAKTAR